MRFFSLFGSNATSARGRLSENVRERRVERAEREAARKDEDTEDDRAGQQRISAFNAMPMRASEIQLEAEATARRHRRFRRRND